MIRLIRRRRGLSRWGYGFTELTLYQGYLTRLLFISVVWSLLDQNLEKPFHIFNLNRKCFSCPSPLYVFPSSLLYIRPYVDNGISF